MKRVKFVPVILAATFLLPACAPQSKAVYQPVITNPGLTIQGPHSSSPVVVNNVDSRERPTGGFYLDNSDHTAEMINNINAQRQN